MKVGRHNSQRDGSNPHISRSHEIHNSSKRAQQDPDFSIVHFNIEDAPPYEAVSYVWGNPDRSHHITLTDGRNLMVTATIAYALPHLLRVCETSYLWIDQITIDQSNLAEREEQVKVMGQIYSRSFRCLVWLDDGNTLPIESDLEPAWATEIGEEVRRFLRCFTVGEDEQPSYRAPALRRMSSQANVREHLLWFLEHPWFRR